MANVLLIEDDETVSAALSFLMKSSGHTVTCLCDGTAAVSTLRNEHFDLLITDMAMPGKDGFETLSEIRKAGISDVPMIAMSGQADSDITLRMARRLGAVEALYKPFQSGELITVINRLLARQSSQVHSPRSCITGV